MNNKLQDRLKKISVKAENDKTAALEKELKHDKNLKDGLEKIVELSARISDLIFVANECIKQGVKFPDARYSPKEKFGLSYHYEAFCTDGINHSVGFIIGKGRLINYVGIENGGFNGVYDFYTNGHETFYVHEKTKQRIDPELHDINKFLDQFDTFEDSFYKWVDSLE